MKLNIYTVFDAKADVYMQPFFMPTEALALRAMKDCLNDPNHTFTLYPEDFFLYILGIFDNVDGSIEYKPAKRIACLTDLTGE